MFQVRRSDHVCSRSGVSLLLGDAKRFTSVAEVSKRVGLILYQRAFFDMCEARVRSWRARNLSVVRGVTES